MPKVDRVPLGGTILDPCSDWESCREELFIFPAPSKVLAHGWWSVDNPSYHEFMRTRSHKCSQGHTSLVASGLWCHITWIFCFLSMLTIRYISIMRAIRRNNINLFSNFFKCSQVCLYIFIMSYQKKKPLWGDLRICILKKETFICIADTGYTGIKEQSILWLISFLIVDNRLMQLFSGRAGMNIYCFIFAFTYSFSKHLLSDFCGSGIAFSVGDKATGGRVATVQWLSAERGDN